MNMSRPALLVFHGYFPWLNMPYKAGRDICQHNNKTFQPAEPENNVQAMYYCADCGEELPLPEPDWDLMRKDF